MKAILLSLWLLIVAGGGLAIYFYPARETSTAIAGNNSEQRTAQYFQSIRNQPARVQAFLKSMPKGADLHTHLSGAIYAETFLAWAATGKMCVDPTTFILA